MKFWLFIGIPDHIEQGFRRKRWALKDRDIANISVNDYVVFYVTDYSKVVGFARIADIYYQNPAVPDLEWKKEIKGGKVIWPWRIIFSSILGLSRDKWEDLGISLPMHIQEQVRRGQTSVIELKLGDYKKLLQQAEESWGVIIRI